MVDRIIDLYRSYISHVVMVVSPPFVDEARRRMAMNNVPGTVHVQERPTGMLDAVLLARQTVENSDAERVWITWCDQVAIHPLTAARLAAYSDEQAVAPVILPVACRTTPYIHLQRDAAGRIVRILQRREGDAMPEIGESDAGLFSLSRTAFVEQLPRYAASVDTGAATGERNLLPFIPWIAMSSDVVTFPVHDEMEAVGVNTPQELTAVEAYLAARADV
jgi:bifunctional N-acetylglucosamine-1-phosphate-uridyltransferase/glucosamine-1-phosphate-acetyltransferase GlmU-like protein